MFAGCLPLLASAQTIDHSKMDHGQVQQPAPEPAHEVHDSGEAAVTEPRTPIPVPTQADRQAATPASTMHMFGDKAIRSYTLLNRLEVRDASPGTAMAWEGEGWIGQDINRLWWRTEGERVDGETEAANLEALYGHAFSPWWDWVAGVRQDLKPGPDRTYAAFGLRGLAPQWFEVSLTGYVGTGGRTMARFETEYDLLLTNRLILQPLLESQLYGKSDTARGIGAGLATIEAGLRLRYEFTRRFAPYVGVNYERAFGKTADLRRAAQEDVGNVRAVAGVRIWF
jgi:copper resistance protein B